MGVIKRPKFQPIYPTDGDAVAEFLENEALSQPDTQVAPVVEEDPQILSSDQHQQTGQLPRDTVIHPPQLARSRWARKSVVEEKYPKGQKKRRRYENNKYLLNLVKSENHSDSVATETKTAFSRLFQQKDKMAAWNSFRSLSEDDQLAIIANNEIYAYFNNEAILEEAPECVVKQIHNYRDTRRKMTADEAFDAMCPKLKSIFTKRHFPMGILMHLENEILEFFSTSPKETYVVERQCSFDRLILHAITHFNVLFSQSFTKDGNRRETRVRNLCADFQPPIVSLPDYIQMKRP